MSNSQNSFNENVAIWERINPKAAVFLPYIESNQLQFCKTENNEVNLKRTEQEATFYYHSEKDAAKESKEWFKTLKLDDAKVLYVFGVGLGYAYEAARNWLQQDPNHRIVFLEDDLPVIRRLFETEIGTRLLHDPQAMLLHFDNLEDKMSLIHELYWHFLTTSIVVSALPVYAQRRPELFADLKHKLAYDASVRSVLLQEYLQYGIVFFRNFYPNILQLSGASLGDALVGQFHGIPAVICGAGPSLNKQLPLIKQLSGKALVFAGGSAINALNSAGIQPHIAAGIDPNLSQFERLSKNTAYEIPFLYRNRLEYHALKNIHAPRLYVTGSGGYEVAEWFDNKLGIVGQDLDEGFNVVNFCLDIARSWGCNPIIFVGMDLAFTDMESYAKGIVEQTKMTEEEMLTKTDREEAAFLKPDIYGKPVYTLWKWIAESQWISEFAQEHPDLKVINATEGGIGFTDVENLDFKTAIQRHLTRDYDLHSLLHGEIQNHTLPDVTPEKLRTLLEDLRDSLIRSNDYLVTLINEANTLITHIQNEQKMPATPQSGKAALAEIELADEDAYRAILNIFNVVYSKVLNQELRTLNQLQTPEWQKLIQKIQINNKKLLFLHHTALANLKMINDALA